MNYMQFTTNDGYKYIFIGKNRLAIINDTNDGKGFGGEKFIAIKELSLDEVINLKNYHQAVEAIITGSSSYLITIISPKL